MTNPTDSAERVAVEQRHRNVVHRILHNKTFTARRVIDGRHVLQGAVPYSDVVEAFAQFERDCLAALSPAATPDLVEREEAARVLGDDKCLEMAVDRAAVEWCGDKERETFSSDIAYFKHNWRSSPGFRTRVAQCALRNPKVLLGASGGETFQAGVGQWMQACFGPEISADTVERNHRFLEEALELVQACGCTASEAHQLIDYVFSRPVGEKGQEVGGVMVTLAALCLANGLNMDGEAATELIRVWTKVEQIRAKQAAKPKHSPLPAALTPPSADTERLVRETVECHGLDTLERVCFYEQDFYVLSNFSSFTLQWRGIRFDTLEAAYHWEKFVPAGFMGSVAAGVREHIRTAPSAHEAFQIAQKNKGLRRPDWDAVKVGIMRELIRAKADQHEYVRRKLLATGDRELVENSWRDDFWGWGPNRDGQNMLGKLWMELRAAIRALPTKARELDHG